MRRIQCLNDFNYIEGEFIDDYVVYLRGEFYNLYEYLSNGESSIEFILPFHQSMIILENEGEFNRLIMDEEKNIEFIEKIIINMETSLNRIGLLQFQDIQLYYFLRYN
ncbi:hypothetical protein FH490_05635 [Bacillus velezensis]|uniref:hypothetical protein n=1 Tax=Bacillus velezensis TaxID=492670 RepID=UPI00111E895A|nr:hypothetical protein [Bacillus velezensis]TNU29706.1 hypothetical protein FH490_05635 [Bacillus velezensis]